MSMNNRNLTTRGLNDVRYQPAALQASQERLPMPAGTVIPIPGTDILITRDGDAQEYSAGSTCLVYRGHILAGTGIVAGMRVIIKEFYPRLEDAPCGFCRREDGSLHADSSWLESEACRKFRAQFQQGLAFQKELAGSNAMEISIRPLFECQWGSSLYIISDAHHGTDLGAERPDDLRDILSVAISLSEAMGVLHGSGYIMTDIKADNFLWIRKPNAVRIIDTDSLVPFRDISRMPLQALFSNRNHFSPELEFLYRKIQEGASEQEMTMLKKAMLVPSADRYALGILLFELLFGRLPDFSGRDTCLKDKRRMRRASGKSANQDFLPPAEELFSRFREELSSSGNPGLSLPLSLVEILSKLLIYSPLERGVRGYRGEDALVSDLQTAYARLTSEKLVLRREAARANARFAAYNLLQKHPLFDYTAKSSAQHQGCREELRVALIGRHAMRADMLSAVLSIGQMPDLPLNIELISDDAAKFWEEFISEKQNPALGRAVTWEYLPARGSFHAPVSGTTPDTYDHGLVDRALAHLTLCRMETPAEGRSDLNLPETACMANYIILLEEDPERRNSWIRQLLARAEREQQRVFIGYLQIENDPFPVLTQGQESFVTLYPVSLEAFTETYSEKMFSEKIYAMGLMAHAYYCKAMEEPPEGESIVDMHALEQQFRSDIYNITSSERCALHGLYKLAGVGIDRNRPGRFLRYYRKTEDPEILEELAWIEHLSWTAFLLTSGAVPVSIKDFDSYAYQGNNDWKDKADPAHLRHPLLAASSRHPFYTLRGIQKTEDVTQEIYDSLDPLDRISVDIARWYAAHREQFRMRYLEWIRQLSELCAKAVILTSASVPNGTAPSPAGHTPPGDPAIDIRDTACNSLCLPATKNTSAGHDKMRLQTKQQIQTLQAAGLSCIEKAGESLVRQNAFCRESWEIAAERIRTSFHGIEDIERHLEKGKKTVMKPVFDALEDRDFKQYDRDLTYAVIDMIA